MSLKTLMYVSRCNIAPEYEGGELNRILDTALGFNPTAGITGALLFTGSHFAQVLEGDEASIYSLLASISRDPRHDEVQIVLCDPLAKRRFPDWSMAYSGPSHYVSDYVMRVLNDPKPFDVRRSAEALADMIFLLKAD